MAINAIAEVLAGHADAGPFPVAEVVGVHEVPVIHHHSCVSTSVLLAIGGVGKRLFLACRLAGAPGDSIGLAVGDLPGCVQHGMKENRVFWLLMASAREIYRLTGSGQSLKSGSARPAAKAASMAFCGNAVSPF